MDVGATQLVGSQSQQPILLNQPPFEVIGKQPLRRTGRGQETFCLIRFIGEADDATVYVSRSKLMDAPGGREALAAYEAAAEAAHYPGGLQDTEGDIDLGSLPAESMPVPEQLPTQRPWTQQPSEPQLPQTQQPYPASPGFEMPSQPYQEEPVSFGGSLGMQQPRSTHLGGVASDVRRANQGCSRIVNGLPSSLWEDPFRHIRRRHGQYCSPIAEESPGMQTAPANVFGHFAAQSQQQMHSGPNRQDPSPSACAAQHEQHSPHIHRQPQEVFERAAARTRSHEAPSHLNRGPHEQWQTMDRSDHLQPRNACEGLAAHSHGHQEVQLPAQVPQHEWRTAPPQPQQRPQNTSEALAASIRGHREAPNLADAPQQGWRSAPPQEQQQPQNTFQALAAHTRGHQEAPTLTSAPQQEWRPAPPQVQLQPQNTFERLAAHSRGHQQRPISAEALQPPVSANVPDQEWRDVSRHKQQQPRTAFEELAACTRHLDERHLAASADQGHLPAGQARAPAGNQMGSTSRPVHGATLRPHIQQCQHHEWISHHNASTDMHGSQNPGEASFSFNPMEATQQTVHAQRSPDIRSYLAHRQPSQQPQSQIARPVPASFQQRGAWPASAYRNAGYSVPMQQIAQHQAGTMRQPGRVGSSSVIQKDAQDSAMRSAAADPRSVHEVRHVEQEQPPPALESMTISQAHAQPQELAQARAQGFYDTWLQTLSANMPAHAPARPGAQHYRAFSTAQPAQRAASMARMQSTAAPGYAALSSAPAPQESAQPAPQAPRPQQGFEHQEPMHSLDDAADTDDAAVALAMLGRDAAQRIRAQACPKSVPPAQPQGTQLPYVSAPAWGAWVPTINQMAQRKTTGEQGEATGPSAQNVEAEDPMEASPAPLQQRLNAAAQEPQQRQAPQRKPLKRVYAGDKLDAARHAAEPDPPQSHAAHANSPQKEFRRLVKKTAIDMIEKAAQANDSETGSSAERFIEQTLRPKIKIEPKEPVSDTVLDSEPPAGAREHPEPRESGAGVDLARSSAPIPASAAKEPETPDHAEGDNLQERLTVTGWEGAVIRRAKHQLNASGEEELQVQILWPDEYCEWVDRTELHTRPHTHLTLIRFYESKTRPK